MEFDNYKIYAYPTSSYYRRGLIVGSPSPHEVFRDTGWNHYGWFPVPEVVKLDGHSKWWLAKLYSPISLQGVELNFSDLDWSWAQKVVYDEGVRQTRANMLYSGQHCRTLTYLFHAIGGPKDFRFEPYEKPEFRWPWSKRKN